ncbi:MAG: ATP-dependent endonuclease, partial [Candidatus Bipolaricaulia bacterium]
RPPISPTAFKGRFPLEIGFVPILGPVEHNEPLYQKEAARAALLTHRASRNFRNIWYHYPDHFDEFRAMIQETWPGMDIERPEVDRSYPKPVLHMFCPEERIPREVYWAGFGFQVWCQMLTFMVSNKSASLFIIDEPDIYLHSDLQRQLVSALRSLGPDILLATHSTEIISEADPDEILVVTKKARSAKRVGDPAQLLPVFETLGSNLNPTLTQLARSRRVVYVEGKDFQVLARFAAKLGYRATATRSSFAVVQTHGFEPKKVRVFTDGIEATLSFKVSVAVLFDRDYRCDAEVNEVRDGLSSFCDYVHIHEMKELENFLLVPSAIERAARKRMADQAKRTGTLANCDLDVRAMLQTITDEMKYEVQAQFQEKRRPYAKSADPSLDDTSIAVALLEQFDEAWGKFDRRLALVPGKAVLGKLRSQIHASCGVNISANSIIDCMTAAEVPEEMREMLRRLEEFATKSLRSA